MKNKLNKWVLTMLSTVLIITTMSIGVLTHAQESVSKGADVEGLVTSKTATDNKDGTFTLNLEAYATGKTVTVMKPVPLDIVLVLDQSGSMETSFGTKYKEVSALNTKEDYYVLKDDKYVTVSFSRKKGWTDNNGNRYYPEQTVFYSGVEITRMEALQDAANQFITNVEKNGSDNKVDHRIAVVGFASKSGYGDNTALLSVTNKNKVTYLNAKDADYANSFQSINVKTGKDRISQSINNLKTKGATRSDLGMDMANQLFKNNPIKADSDRERVTIMFTDGEPNDLSGFDASVANAAILNSNTSKNTDASSVFSVGILKDITNLNDMTKNINKYMHYVSSNYPNATSLNNAGTIASKPNFYMLATDSTSLNDVFKTISDTIQNPAVNLDKTTVLKDFVSDDFEMIKDNPYEIYTQDYLGGDINSSASWGSLSPVDNKVIKASINKETKEIDVTGFDYAANFVQAGKAGGKKLVVKLKVKAHDGFLGGSNLPTNKPESGIYEPDIPGKPGKVVENFEKPKVDVKMLAPLEAQDQAVYAGYIWKDMTLLNPKAEDKLLTYEIDNKEYKIDGINNKFVDITFTYKIDNVEVTYTIPAGKTKVEVSDTQVAIAMLNDKNATVTIKVEDSSKKQTAVTKIENKKIYVYTPTINTNDGTIFLGESISLKENVDSDKILWTYEPTTTGIPKPIGDKPSLEYEMQLVDGTAISDSTKFAPENDVEIKIIKVWNGNTDIKSVTSFHNNGTSADSKGIFKIRVVKGELQIKKSIDNQYTSLEEINANQSFIFKIDVRDEKDGKIKSTYYQTIDFSANEKETSKTIILKGLRKGFYTISEVSDWSWKYDEQSNQRIDNYTGNGSMAGSTEGIDIAIGEKLATEKLYFGIEEETTVNEVHISNPATLKFVNKIEYGNILGDTANAINSFTKKEDGTNK